MRLLTKSRFKTARECPTKLYYTKKKEYANASDSDPFMEALAEGGFQVGELAKCYFPDGVDITELDYGKSIEQTNACLASDNAVVFEAAVRHDSLFIRVDVFEQIGDRVNVIEVKAKSFDLRTHEGFFNSKGEISSGWKSYLEDVAFQTYVTRKAYPDKKVYPYLMLVDKSAKAETTGLNQKFRIVEDEYDRKSVEVVGLDASDLESKILTKLDVSKEVEFILNSLDVVEEYAWSFVEAIDNFAQAYKDDKRLNARIGTRCKHCEFKCSNDDYDAGLKSGFDECWKSKVNNVPVKDTVLDVWNFRGANKLIEQGIFLIEQVKEADIEPDNVISNGLNTKQRQWMQVEKLQDKDASVYFDVAAMKKEMQSWSYPLHFIDFETSTTAIPFIKGMSPYETTAFQYSHHMVEESGVIRHANEFLMVEPGSFPNYEFSRSLKEALEQDEGSVFMFASHENTVLNQIISQLEKDSTPPQDKDELIGFMKSITKSSGKSSSRWRGERCLIDMCQLVKKYHYDPRTKGSNSIKAVLPAVLNSSEYLKNKYTQSIYGTDEIPSRNFNEHQWIDIDDGQVVNPYKSLIPASEGVRTNNVATITDGGSALKAYGYLQYIDLSKEERELIKSALLRYCELDTMAMVMIYEAWLDWIK